VPVLHLTPALDDDVGVRLEQADQFLGRRYRLAIENPAFGLADDARDQRQEMVDLGTPARDRRLGDLGEPGGGGLQFGPAGLGGGNQLAIELTLLVLSAAVLDGAGPFLRQAAAVAPRGRRRCWQIFGAT
jgi:hypothetical protein